MPLKHSTGRSDAPTTMAPSAQTTESIAPWLANWRRFDRASEASHDSEGVIVVLAEAPPLQECEYSSQLLSAFEAPSGDTTVRGAEP